MRAAAHTSVHSVGDACEEFFQVNRQPLLSVFLHTLRRRRREKRLASQFWKLLGGVSPVEVLELDVKYMLVRGSQMVGTVCWQSERTTVCNKSKQL